MAVTDQAAPRYVLLGRILAPHGLQGWLGVRSFADPPESLLQHNLWRLRAANGQLRVERLRDAQWDGHRMRVAFEAIQTRTAAEALTGCEIDIERAELPPPGEREYYRDDLLGFRVSNTSGALLGTLQHFVEAPVHAVMVIRGEREYWVPATPLHLRRVDLAERLIEVDWPADF